MTPTHPPLPPHPPVYTMDVVVMGIALVVLQVGTPQGTALLRCPAPSPSFLIEKQPSDWASRCRRAVFFFVLCPFSFFCARQERRRGSSQGSKTPHLEGFNPVERAPRVGSVRFVHRAACIAAAAFATREPLTVAQGSPVGEQSIQGTKAPGLTVPRLRGTPITASSRTRRAPSAALGH